MFILTSAYTRVLDDKALVGEHLAFVARGYDEDRFVASGPRQPAIGGLIIARGDDEADLRAFMEQDPFVRDGVAQYEYTLFKASRAVHEDLVET